MALVRRYLLDKDCLGGALVIALGTGAIVAGLGYRLGSLARMGPGFFPTVIGVVMVLTGSAILFGGVRSAGADGRGIVAPDIRAWLMVPLSLIAFIVVGAQAGLLPATVSLVVIAALADRGNGWRGIVVLSSAISATCLVVFWWALKVQFPLLAFGSG